MAVEGSPKTPVRQYAESVLGKAATQAQLDDLFREWPAAYPIVTRGQMLVRVAAESLVCNRLVTCVDILSCQPAPNQGGSCLLVGKGEAVLNPEDTNSKRLGLTIAFGRAYKQAVGER